MRFNFLKQCFLILILGLFSLSASSQKKKDKQQIEFDLGLQHYEQKEYEKAIHYFQKLYNGQPKKNYYELLFNSFIAIDNFKKAEKLAKKQIKLAPKQYEYKFNLGYLYTLLGDNKKANEQYSKSINDACNFQVTVIELANKFISINELEYAEQTYRKGTKKIKNYPFNFELAQLYYQKQDYSSMIREYMDLLAINSGYSQSVQNSLQSALDPDPENKKKELLRTELLNRIQKNPSSTVFSEMLIWLYVQEKDFGGAFIQAKALDKRNKESGNRIMALAKLCRSNKNYEVAINAYEYIIAKGTEGSRYQQAKKELVEVFNEKIISSVFTEKDLLDLKQLYKSTIFELSTNNITIGLQKGLAHLEAFYLHQIDSAIEILETALRIPNLSEQEEAECKLELGDIYLVANEIWEASLLYSQVEKAFKYDQIGEQAKFKNAKVFYYSGDFKWAKAQLDVLKGSTSKLISNDAMELSLLISDNITVDTLKLPLYKFAQCDLLILQNKLEEAFLLLDSIEYLFPAHALADEILFKKYEIFNKKREYEKAAEQLNKVYNYDPSDILADNSLFLLAQLNDGQLQNKEKAMELYKLLMTDHADSIFVSEARKRYRELRGDSIN